MSKRKAMRWSELGEIRGTFEWRWLVMCQLWGGGSDYGCSLSALWRPYLPIIFFISFCFIPLWPPSSRMLFYHLDLTVSERELAATSDTSNHNMLGSALIADFVPSRNYSISTWTFWARLHALCTKSLYVSHCLEEGAVYVNGKLYWIKGD